MCDKGYVMRDGIVVWERRMSHPALSMSAGSRWTKKRKRFFGQIHRVPVDILRCRISQIPRLLFALVVPLLLSSCRPAEDHPVGSIRFVDCAGRAVVLKKPAERIVLIRGRDLYNLSLLLGDEITNRVVAIGCDIRSVDRDIYLQLVERYPAVADLACMGSVYRNGVSMEKLIAYEPDLVVMDVFMKKRGYSIVDGIERAGLTALYLDLSTDPFCGPQQSLRVLGKALGREERAEEIAAFLDGRIAPLMERLAAIPDDRLPSVYIEAGHQGVATYGPTYGRDGDGNQSSWGRVVEAARGRNIAEIGVSGMAPVRPEALLAADPDVIVLTGAHWRAVPDSLRLGGKTDASLAGQRLAAFTARPGWNELGAVKNGRVYGIYHGWCIHATAFAALEYCAKWFHPELFRELNPAEDLREFHERFAPVPYEGTYAVEL